jgi:hypothetical protein
MVGKGPGRHTINPQEPVFLLHALRDIDMHRFVREAQLLQRDGDLLPVGRARRIEPVSFPLVSSCPIIMRAGMGGTWNARDIRLWSLHPSLGRRG